jgi:rhodanese-related sulfurtransferase
MRLKRAILQAVTIGVLSVTVAFIHNAFSKNGINPFRKVSEVPVYENGNGNAGATGIRLISLDKVKEFVEEGRTVIDARTAEEYSSGHIPGAILCDYYEMGTYFEKVLPLLDPLEEIVLYCSGPLCDDSELLGRELFALGYERLNLFKGGMEEWSEAGMPVETGMGGLME